MLREKTPDEMTANCPECGAYNGLTGDEMQGFGCRDCGARPQYVYDPTFGHGPWNDWNAFVQAVISTMDSFPGRAAAELSAEDPVARETALRGLADMLSAYELGRDTAILYGEEPESGWEGEIYTSVYDFVWNHVRSADGELSDICAAKICKMNILEGK